LALDLSYWPCNEERVTSPDPTTTPRFTLRNATAESHDAVDAVFSAFALDDAEGYRRFLRAQAAAFLPVESALEGAGIARLVPDWPERRRAALLHADLEELGENPPDAIAAPPIDDAASALGAAYVLEGSRMGGQLLRRMLPESMPARFLSAPMQPGSWRRLTDLLDESLHLPGDMVTAVASARAVFACFEAAGRRERDRA
jgi:heme oxygenase